LSDDDAFIRSAAVCALAQTVFREHILAEVENKNPRVRLGAVLALRRARFGNPVQLLEGPLADPDEQVRRMADDALVLRQGRLVESGAVAAVGDVNGAQA